MTVANTSRKASFNGSGTTGPFDFTFPIILANDGSPYITVKKITVATGAQETLAYPADYTFVASGGGLSGGSVTTTDVVAAGYRLVVSANTPVDQLVRYSNQGTFFPETHERSFDKLTMIAIESAAVNANSIRFPIADEVQGNGELPLAAARASKFVYFDANGDVTVVTAADASLVAVSAYMATVLVASTAAAARTTLGLGTAAIKDTGTSGDAIPLLNAANTFSTTTTFANTSISNMVSTDVVRVARSGDAFVNIQSPNTNIVGLLFSDPDDRDVAGITYDHSTNQMSVVVNAATVATISSAGVVSLPNGLSVGGGATQSKILSATASLDYGSIAAGASADLTITVTGASTSGRDEVGVGLAAGPNAGLIYQGFVSAADTVTIRACNFTTGAINPTAQTIRAKVTQFA